MKSIEIYISPQLRELDEGLVLTFLDKDLKRNRVSKQDFYLINDNKEKICDFVINSIPYNKAKKLVSIINKLDDYSAKINEVKSIKILIGPLRFE